MFKMLSKNSFIDLFIINGLQPSVMVLFDVSLPCCYYFCFLKITVVFSLGLNA